MAEPTNPLIAFSNAAAQVVERSASSIVAVHGGGRWPSSGIHWRSGVIVTAEEVLERDEDIKVALPGGRVVAASLAGRDPSTDVAVLRFQPDGLTAAPTADAASLRPGHVVLAIGNHEGAPIASLGIVAIAGPAWHSLRGGTIDSLIRLDRPLSPAAEGGAVVAVQGRVVGMAVLGPRRRALAIPTSPRACLTHNLASAGTPRGSFHAPICAKPAITLSRKDWHLDANRAVVCLFPAQGAPRDPAPLAAWPRWGCGGGGQRRRTDAIEDPDVKTYRYSTRHFVRGSAAP